MTIKLLFEEHHEPPFDCDCCGTCYPDHWTISLESDGQRVLLWEYDHDGHMGGYQTEGCIVTRMRDALLGLHTDMSNGGDYQCKSIIYCHAKCEEFAQGLYNQWLKVKAYALALEDDGWEIEVVEEK